MIYTVTFNPSLDYTVHMPVFRAGAINRVVQEAVYPGGRLYRSGNRTAFRSGRLPV